MTGESLISKSDLTDPNVGFVSINDVKNVFIEVMRDLDKYVMPAGQPVHRMEVLKCVESIQYKLYTRAHANIDKFFPGYRPPKSDKPKEDPAVLKQSAEDRAQRIAAIRSRS